MKRTPLAAERCCAAAAPSSQGDGRRGRLDGGETQRLPYVKMQHYLWCLDSHYQDTHPTNINAAPHKLRLSAAQSRPAYSRLPHEVVR